MLKQVKVGRTLFGHDGTYRGEVEPLMVGSVVLTVRLVFEGDIPTVYVYGAGQDGCNQTIDDDGDPVVVVETVDDSSLRRSLELEVARLMNVGADDILWPFHRSERESFRESGPSVVIGVY